LNTSLNHIAHNPLRTTE